MAGVADAELVDRAVALPPGPELSAALNGILREDIPNARLVLPPRPDLAERS